MTGIPLLNPPLPAMRISTILLVLIASAAHAQVNTEWMRKEAGSEGIHGGISLGATVEQGNSDVLDLNSSGRIDGRFGRIYAFVVGSYRRSLSGGEAYRNNAFAHVRVAIPLDTTGFVRVELFGQKQFDDFLRLKDRNLGGAGARIRIVDLSSDSTSILAHLGIGGMFESELSADSIDARTDLVRSTNYLTISGRVTPWTSVVATTYYQPAITRIHDYRLLVEGSVNFKLSTFLSLFVAMNYRFDNEPHAGLRRYDLKITNGISVDF